MVGERPALGGGPEVQMLIASREHPSQVTRGLGESGDAFDEMRRSLCRTILETGGGTGAASQTHDRTVSEPCCGLSSSLPSLQPQPHVVASLQQQHACFAGSSRPESRAKTPLDAENR